MRFLADSFALTLSLGACFLSSAALAQVPLLSNATAPANDFGTIFEPTTQKAVTFTVGSFDLIITSLQASLDIDVGTTPGTVSAAIYLANGSDDPNVLSGFVGSLGSRTVTTPFGGATNCTDGKEA